MLSAALNHLRAPDKSLNKQLVTSSTWAAAAQGRLDDPSTLAFLAACGSLVEQSPHVLAQLRSEGKLRIAVAQASG